jgi:translation initiation factor IF-3
MMEARAMSLVIAPKPAVMQRVSAMKAALEKARQQAEKEGKPLPPPPPSSLDELPDDDDDDDDEIGDDEE